jgi:uncharacterized protein
MSVVDFLTTPARQAATLEETDHRPWPLQPAEAELARNTMPPPGIRTEGEPLVHYAARQDVVIWPLRPIGPEGGDG